VTEFSWAHRIDNMMRDVFKMTNDASNRRISGLVRRRSLLLKVERSMRTTATLVEISTRSVGEQRAVNVLSNRRMGNVITVCTVVQNYCKGLSMEHPDF